MSNLAVHFSSAKAEWATPWWFFEKLSAEFRFVLDVCATAGNTKCQCYYTPEQDGLSKPWFGACWMNPPYGRAIGKWVSKARREALAGATLVCLLPSRTDTKWWHENIWDRT